MEVQRTSSPLLSSLPADLLHQILEYSSSMDDFSAAIQTSKQIYRVYKDRSGSILRSVACNHMGMTEEIFPLAFSLVLHHERARESELPVKDWLREDEVSASYLNPPRFRKMVSNHDVVRRLEKFFSRSHKDSRFGYSVLSDIETHRFQTAAYLFWQFQVLFGIDKSAKVLPWEYNEPPPEDQLLTRRSFLERIPTMSLLHLSAFKDYLLGWAEYNYQYLADERLIEDFLIDLTREQSHHLLLCAGLDCVFNDLEPCEIFDTVEGFNQKYARLQHWFTKDLDIAIVSRGIPPQVKNSDAQLVIRQGPTFSGCRRCAYNTQPLYNNTI